MLEKCIEDKIDRRFFIKAKLEKKYYKFEFYLCVGIFVITGFLCSFNLDNWLAIFILIFTIAWGISTGVFLGNADMGFYTDDARYKRAVRKQQKKRLKEQTKKRECWRNKCWQK